MLINLLRLKGLKKNTRLMGGGEGGGRKTYRRGGA